MIKRFHLFYTLVIDMSSMHTYIYLREINIEIKQGCIQLIKNTVKYV